MELHELKRVQVIEKELGIDPTFERVLCFVDYGNVDYWYRDDRQTAENVALADDEKLGVNLDGLKGFCDLLGQNARFYYGHSPDSLSYLQAAKHAFGKRVYTKQIQWVRHYLTDAEAEVNTRAAHTDRGGTYILIPKCNFDVEITVDAIRLLEDYDTIALFSGDADFVSLLRFLKKKNKKVILLKGGNITASLRAEADLVVSAQSIKKHITWVKKRKPGN